MCNINPEKSVIFNTTNSSCPIGEINGKKNINERKEIIMNQNEMVTEIVNFKTINGISNNELIKIINDLDTNFLSKTKGYIDTELIKGKEEQTWIIIIHWRTMVEANEGIKEFANSPLTEEYRNVLDPKSVSFHFTEQIQTWKAAQ